MGIPPTTIDKQVVKENNEEQFINKIKYLRSKFTAEGEIEKPVEFKKDKSHALYFSENLDTVKNPGKLYIFIQEFVDLMFSSDKFNKMSDNEKYAIWDKLEEENHKTLGEMLNKAEELLLESKN